MILFLCACAFVYFVFFHNWNESQQNTLHYNQEYQWERQGAYAYLSQTLPTHIQNATYFCHIKHQGRIIQSRVSYFNDNDGNFCAVSFLNNKKEICLAIPLNSLTLPRNIDVNVEIIVEQHIKTNGQTTVQKSHINKTLYIDNQPFIFIEWLKPALRIQTHFALYYNKSNQRENWQSTYIKIIKDCYQAVLNNQTQEINCLKHSLKTIGAMPVNLDVAFKEYHNRSLFVFSANDIFMSIASMMQYKIEQNIISDIHSTCKELKNIGIKLKADDECIYHALHILQSMHNKSHHSHQSHQQHTSQTDKEWAFEILGVSGNATQAELKKAYRKKMAEVHPDKYQQLPDNVKKILEKATQDINKAKEILGF